MAIRRIFREGEDVLRRRCRLLVKCRNNREWRRVLSAAIDRFAAENREVRPAVDCWYDSNV